MLVFTGMGRIFASTSDESSGSSTRPTHVMPPSHPSCSLFRASDMKRSEAPLPASTRPSSVAQVSSVRQLVVPTATTRDPLARARATAALGADASHVGIRGRDNALRRALSRWCGLGVLGVAFTHAIDATCSIEVHTGAAPATAMLFVCNSKRWTRRQREQRPTLLRKSERHATRSTMR